MKRRILAFSLVLLSLSIFVSGTVAFFSEDGRTTNVITLGVVDMELNYGDSDARWYPTEGNLGYKFNGLLEPGMTISRKVVIVNAEKQPFFLRYRVNVDIIAADGSRLDSGAIQLQGGNSHYSLKGDDGWRYYDVSGNDEVGKNKQITVFENIHFLPETGNLYQGCTVNISVEAQAVQSKNQVGPDGAEVTEVLLASGWPADSVKGGDQP